LKTYQGSVLILLKIAEALFGAAMVIMMGRVLGAEFFGAFAFGLASVTLLSIPFKIGVSTMISKEVAISSYNNKKKISSTIKMSVYAATVYSLFLTVLFHSILLFFPDVSLLLYSTAMCSLFLHCVCFMGLLEGVLRGYFRPVSAIFIGTVLVPAIMVILLVMLPSKITASNLQNAIYLYIVTTNIVLVAATIWTWPDIKPLLSQDDHFSLSFRAWLVISAPFVIVTGLLVFNRQIDLILIGILAGEREAGIYRLASQAAILVTFGVQAIGHLYAPYFAKIDLSQDRKLISEYLNKSISISTTFGIFVVFFLFIWGRDFIVILAGPEFKEGYTPMIILCAANIAVALNGAMSQALYMQGYQSKVARIYGGAALFSLITNYIMIYHFGILGAALATSLTILLWSIWLRLLACNIWYLSFFTLKPCNNN
jgi:O-antigen/teichoic acid export membrane protein